MEMAVLSNAKFTKCVHRTDNFLLVTAHDCPSFIELALAAIHASSSGSAS